MCIHKSNQRWVLKPFIFKLLHYFGNQVKSNSHYTHFLASEKCEKRGGRKKRKSSFSKLVSEAIAAAALMLLLLTISLDYPDLAKLLTFLLELEA